MTLSFTLIDTQVIAVNDAYRSVDKNKKGRFIATFFFVNQQLTAY